MSSEVGMSRLTDDELSTLYYKGYASKMPQKGCHRAALRAVADAAVAAYLAEQVTVDDSVLAGKIMTLLGYRVEPSLEPSTDRIRDKIAAMLATHEAKRRHHEQING